MNIEKKAVYFGTTVLGQKVFFGLMARRYTEGTFFMRGNGMLKISKDYIRFSYLGMKKRFSIPIKNITKVEVGKGHAGQYTFKRCVLKISWKHKGLTLISGFKLFSDVNNIKEQLNKL